MKKMSQIIGYALSLKLSKGLASFMQPLIDTLGYLPEHLAKGIIAKGKRGAKSYYPCDVPKMVLTCQHDVTGKVFELEVIGSLTEAIEQMRRFVSDEDYITQVYLLDII